MRKTARQQDHLTVIILGGAGLVLMFIACLMGSTPMGPFRVLAALTGQGADADRLVVWEIRLPRALAAWLTGASLGMAGAALQGLLRNPLAEPGVLGVSASATLGATLVLFFGAGLFAGTLGIPIALPFAVAAAAIAGALLATAFLAAAAIATPSVITLILVGIALSSFAGAVMALLLNLAPNPFTLSDLISWSLGSVANRSLADSAWVLPFMLIGAAISLKTRRDLSALTLGEEAASSLGVNLQRTRLMAVAGTGLMTGASVALAGAIGFVGIVAPHLVRPFCGYHPARILLPSAMLGGAMLVLADIGVRLIPTATELRLGVMAAFVGAPIFAWIAMGRGRNARPRTRPRPRQGQGQEQGQEQCPDGAPANPASARRAPALPVSEPTGLHINDLSVYAGQSRLLDRVSVTAEPGSITVVLGPNGAGKTTLLRSAAGILRPDTGDIRVGGMDLRALSPFQRARTISYLPQHRETAWPITVRDVIALGRLSYGVALSDAGNNDMRIDEALALCGLSPMADRRADTLSGGEQARMHCARAFAAGAPLLLADEPVASLDPRHQLQILHLIRHFADTGGTAVVILHDLSLAARFADQLVWLKDGTLIAAGPVDETLTRERISAVFDVDTDIVAGKTVVLRNVSGSWPVHGQYGSPNPSMLRRSR